MKTARALQTFALLSFVVAVGRADGATPLCAPGVIVTGEHDDEIAAMLRERGVGPPEPGCSAIDVQVRGEGAFWLVSIGDATGRVTNHRAGTPEVAARIIEAAAQQPAAPVALPDELALARDIPGPWLENVAIPATLGVEVDIWKNIAIERFLGGAVEIQGFAVRPRAINLGAILTYNSIPFVWGPVADVSADIAGGGFQVTVPLVPISETSTINLSLGAATARFADMVPMDAHSTDLVPPLRLLHIGIGITR